MLLKVSPNLYLTLNLIPFLWCLKELCNFMVWPWLLALKKWLLLVLNISSPSSQWLLWSTVCQGSAVCIESACAEGEHLFSWGGFHGQRLASSFRPPNFPPSSCPICSDHMEKGTVSTFTASIFLWSSDPMVLQVPSSANIQVRCSFLEHRQEEAHTSWGPREYFRGWNRENNGCEYYSELVCPSLFS